MLTDTEAGADAASLLHMFPNANDIGALRRETMPG